MMKVNLYILYLLSRLRNTYLKMSFQRFSKKATRIFEIKAWWLHWNHFVWSIPPFYSVDNEGMNLLIWVSIKVRWIWRGKGGRKKESTDLIWKSNNQWKILFCAKCLNCLCHCYYHWLPLHGENLFEMRKYISFI